MSSVTMGLLGIVALFVLLGLGIHIGVALGLVGILGLVVLVGFEQALNYSALTVSYLTSRYDMIVIPLFVLMGLLASEQGLAEAAYSALSKILGKIRGGLGIATVLGCAAFGTCTGSSLVCAVVFARTSAPAMRKVGYEKKFAYAICTSSGAIGMLIPPSILAVIYGMLTQESIGRLLIAGIGPGLVMAIVFAITILIMTTMNPRLAPLSIETATLKAKLTGLLKAWPIGVIALAVVGGIYTGIMTANEAAAVGTFVVLGLGLALRSLKGQALSKSMVETAHTTAMIFVILVGARIFARFLTLTGITTKLGSLIVGYAVNPVLFIFALMVLYLIMGCFFDSISILSVTLPVIYPTVQALGFDPIWFAMVIIVNMEMGFLTPPVGMNVFGVKGVAEPDVSLEDLFRGIIPFFFAMLTVLVLVIFIPSISTWLPAHMMQK